MARSPLVAFGLVAGCHHSFHPTHVEPGGRVELAAAAVHVTPKHPGGGDPAGEAGTGYDAELAFGYGWREGNGGALLELVLPLEQYFFDATPGEAPALPTPGLFLEGDLVPSRLAVGLGAVLGLRPAAYAQAGLALSRLSIDVGAGIDVGRTRDVYGGLTVRAGTLDVGVWVDFDDYPDDVHEGDDPTDLTYAKTRLAGGLLIRHAFARPHPR